MSKFKIPHLKTTLTGPLLTLEKIFLDQHFKIETWFRQQFNETSPPFYASVDLRNAGFKMAPVDTNLYPAGFNNLNLNLMPLLIHATASTLSHYISYCNRLLLIPENHTRNPYYWENITVLYDILFYAGYDVRIASWVALEQSIHTRSSGLVHVELLQRKGNKLVINDFIPCAILLNNDLSENIPDILKGVTQTFIPPLALGWHQRKKSQHFKLYEKVTRNFAQLLNIDPWLIHPYHDVLNNIDFSEQENLNLLSEKVAIILKKIQKKYEEYHIKQKPFVIIKSDSGTYGMAIMSVFHTDDVKNLNRKQRNKMTSSKSGTAACHFLIQEGIYTQETLGSHHAVAEPVIYMIGQHVVGGFYRFHQKRTDHENLNTPGMHFQTLEISSKPESQYQTNRFYAYTVIARLALIAASKEIGETK